MDKTPIIASTPSISIILRPNCVFILKLPFVHSQSIETGGYLIAPGPPTKNGYECDCWMLNGSPFDFNTQINGDLELTASWIEKIVYYTVNFYSNGEIIKTVAVAKGETIEFINPQPIQGKEFICWTYLGDEFDFSSAINSNTDLIASWKDEEKRKFVVSFDSANGEDVFEVEVEEFACVNQPAIPVKENYYFIGWLCDGVLFDFSLHITENITLIAGWKQKDFDEELVGEWKGLENYDEKDYIVEIVITSNRNCTITVSNFANTFA